MSALIAWQPDDEVDVRNGWQLITDEPITELRSVAHRKDVVVVDLDRAVWDPYPAYDMEPDPTVTWPCSLVWTVWAALDTRDPVLLTIRGACPRHLVRPPRRTRRRRPVGARTWRGAGVRPDVGRSLGWRA